MITTQSIGIVKATPSPAQYTGGAADQSVVFKSVIGSALLAVLALL